MNDINIWNKLFKDINKVGERDFSNFIKQFNISLSSKERHTIMMSIIKTITNKTEK
tara:strand:+ start:113 stop:280 length:168 start_codon:yes stop_codon:yes gene_type:complete